MALKPCRECGQQVSTEAATCPNCGTPDPTGVKAEAAAAKARAARIEQENDADNQKAIIGCVGVGALLVVGFMIFSSLGEDPSPPRTPPPNPAAQTVRDLNATVRKNAIQIDVTNNETRGWSDCKIEINPGIVRGGWAQRIAVIPAGQTVNGGLMAFTKSNGERFDPAEYAVQSITVRCAEGFWSGSFSGG